MSVAAQVAGLDNNTNLSGLVHEVYATKIEPNLPYLDEVAGLFKNGNNDPGVSLTGTQFRFPIEMNSTNDMQGTNGWIPDHSSVNLPSAVVAPTRLYLRRAFDNFYMERMKAPGAYEELGTRIAKSATDSWERGTGIHVHGSASATLCRVGAINSPTSFVLKDAYAHVGTNPFSFIENGMRLAILDVSNNYSVLGIGYVTSVDTTNMTATFSNNMQALGGGNTVAVNDVLVKIGSVDATANNAIPERGYAPLGLRDHLDPDALNTSYLGLSEVTYPKWAPVRATSVDFTEVELMGFAAQIAGQGRTKVTDRSHTCTTHPVVEFELAKTLLGYRSQREFGKVLEGGWTTVKIAGYDVIVSPYHTHDEFMVHCMADYRVLTMGGAGVDGQKSRIDGDTLSRIPDFDGAEWYMYTYLQRILKRRNRSGTLRYIPVSQVDADRFSAVPRRNT